MKKESKVRLTITKLNHLVIECELNSISSRFIVDTGASNSCVNFLSAKKFKINYTKSNEKAYSATNQISKTFFSNYNELKIGDCVKNNFKIILFDMTHINSSLEDEGMTKVDGIIGGDILNEFKAIIDYENGILSLKF